MTRNQLHSVLAVHFLLALFAVVATPALAEDSGPEDTYTCYYRFTCTYSNGYSVTPIIPGSGPSEASAKAEALNNANQARNGCLSMPGNTATLPEFDHCDPVQPGGRKPSPAGATVGSQFIMIAHSCYMKNGNQISHLTYGYREDLIALSEAVWNSMASEAAAKGGIAPGTVRTRIQEMYHYYAFQTVSSKNSDKKIHREYTIQGRGATENEAKANAAQATEKTIADLTAHGEEAQTVGPPRIARKIKFLCCASTKLCVCECTTTAGWTVIATDYASVKAHAYHRASAVANHIGNTLYGGSTTCREIAPREQP